MDSTPFSEVLQKTLVPLLIKYLPIIVTVLVAWVTISQLYFKEDKAANKEHESPAHKPNRKTNASTVNKAPKKKQHPDKWTRDPKQNFTHDWLVTSLKGHSGIILDMDFSANGKFLATCADDRAIFVWSTKDWKEKDHKFIRYNVDYDHASLIRWSPDSKAFVYNRHSENKIDVCKLIRKPDGWIASINKAMTFPEAHNQETTIGLGIAVNGKFIMTSSSGTELVLWDLKGTKISRLDTYLMNNYTAKVSPCGTFIAASGFAPDVKVWEVVFTKSGEFKDVIRAFELTGHTSGVFDFDFSADSSQMVTVSKDGHWRLFNIKIEYAKGEEPHLLKSGKYNCEPNSKNCVAISPDGQVIAIGTGSCLTIINALEGSVDLTIPHVYTGAITKVLFDAAGEYILTCGEKHVRVLHNVTGYKTRLQIAKSKLNVPGNSQATKERLQKTIEESENFLTNFSD